MDQFFDREQLGEGVGHGEVHGIAVVISNRPIVEEMVEVEVDLAAVR